MKAMIIVWDGLRPEFVRRDLTPALCSISERGVTFGNHTAVFPTETRVNSSSLATGCYPDQHGIVANRFWDRDMLAYVNTGDHEDLDRLQAASGSILAVPSLSDRLADAGYRTLAVGSGSPGSTLLQAPTVPGPVINVRGLVRPQAAEDRFLEQYGAFPEESFPPDPWNDLASRVFSDAILTGEYDFGVLWLCDPDFTQHKQGLGSSDSLAAIRVNDGRLAKLLGEIPNEVDLLIASDHGFSTVDPDRRSKDGWLGMEPDRAWFGSSGIYLAEPDRDLEQTVSTVRAQEWMGPVFTRDRGDGFRGVAEATFSIGLLNLDYPSRSPDIVFSRRWTDEVNAYGVKGTVWGAGGAATHGSLSPQDRRCVLIATGPSFRSGVTTSAPSSAVDVTPTLLHLFGLEVPLAGRVLGECLRAEGDSVVPEVTYTRLDSVGGKVPVFARVDGRRYLHGFES